jgi:hypothetical protein
MGNFGFKEPWKILAFGKCRRKRLSYQCFQSFEFPDTLTQSRERGIQKLNGIESRPNHQSESVNRVVRPTTPAIRAETSARLSASLPSFAHRSQFLEFVLPPFHDCGIPSPPTNVGVRLLGGQDCHPSCLTMQTDSVPKRVSVAFPGDPAAGRV